MRLQIAMAVPLLSPKMENRFVAHQSATSHTHRRLISVQTLNHIKLTGDHNDTDSSVSAQFNGA